MPRRRYFWARNQRLHENKNGIVPYSIALGFKNNHGTYIPLDLRKTEAQLQQDIQSFVLRIYNTQVKANRDKFNPINFHFLLCLKL